MWSVCLFLLLSQTLASEGGFESWSKPIEALIASGNLVSAREQLARQTAARREAPTGLYLEARILFAEKRYAEVLKVVQQSIVKAPSDAELYKLAALSAIRLERLDVAAPALETAKRLAPNDYLVRFHLGALYYAKSLFLKARPELKKAAELNPAYMPALLFLGLTLEEVGDEKSTIETYRKAIVLAGEGNEIPYVYLGRYCYRLNRFDDALPVLQRAVQLNPRSGDAWLQLGKTLTALKRNTDAIAALGRSATADSQNSEPHYLLFRIFQAEGREQAAQEELKHFQQLKPKAAEEPGRRRLQGAVAQ